MSSIAYCAIDFLLFIKPLEGIKTSRNQFQKQAIHPSIQPVSQPTIWVINCPAYFVADWQAAGLPRKPILPSGFSRRLVLCGQRKIVIPTTIKQTKNHKLLIKKYKKSHYAPNDFGKKIIRRFFFLFFQLRTKRAIRCQALKQRKKAIGENSH